MSVGHLLFSFHGRVNRAKTWLFSGLAFIGWTFIIVFAVAVIGSDRISQTGSQPDNVHMQDLLASALLPGLVAVLFAGVAFYCGLAVFAKRLHDRGRSAWWLVAFVLGPGFITGLGGTISNQAATGAASDGTIGGIFGLIGLGLYLWGLVELYLLPGTAGDNPYGPDPLAPQS